MKIIALCSGGIDSIVMAALLQHQGHNVHLMHIDYGQVTADAEKQALNYCADYLGIKSRSLLNLSSIAAWGSGSLVDLECKDEFFPHRNLFLITNATVIASKLEAHAVALGVINLSEAQYADCGLTFLSHMGDVLKNDYPPLELLIPLAEMPKSQVISTGLKLNVPLSYTFSCNRMSYRHCWECTSCIERQTSFEEAGINI